MYDTVMVHFPPGNWVTVEEAHAIIAATGRPVSVRRVQALGKPGGPVRSTKALGHLLLDRKQLVVWAKGPRSRGRPRKEA